MIDTIMTFLRRLSFTEKIGKSSKVIPLNTIERKYEYIRQIFQGKKVRVKEYLFMILLDSQENHIKTILLNSMKGNFVAVNRWDIIHPLAKFKPAKIMFTHNHPNGDPTPSIFDYAFTNNMHDICDDNSIQVIDHIIVGNGYYSLAENDTLR